MSKSSLMLCLMPTTVRSCISAVRENLSLRDRLPSQEFVEVKKTGVPNDAPKVCASIGIQSNSYSLRPSLHRHSRDEGRLILHNEHWLDRGGNPTIPRVLIVCVFEEKLFRRITNRIDSATSYAQPDMVQVLRGDWIATPPIYVVYSTGGLLTHRRVNVCYLCRRQA